jgi:murein DD-endopeptidase MepM/ murein hydrolase activator NlpD
MRQLKNFSRGELFKYSIGAVAGNTKKGIMAVSKLPVIGHTVKGFLFMKNVMAWAIPTSQNKKFFLQSIAIASLFLVVTSFTPGGTFVSTAKGYSDTYMSNYLVDGDILVTDDEGYLIKINPLTSDSNRVGLTDFAVHTVESGETLSTIASQYGVSANTIQWENNIRNSNSIRTGQKLLIPPVNGLSYKIQSGDTLEKVAKKYAISSESILAQNNLKESDTLVKGASIFLPNAEPIVSEITLVANTGSRNVTYSKETRSVDYSSIPANTTTPSGGKVFIYPTRGIITNGYKAGHYAIDIADRSKPPIWAAAGGNVIKVFSNGSWNGGYGNYVVIDHGNGLQTLYAHMDSVNVVNGQWVNQGDVIGIMGNTGRVYGVTGIHLHWEVEDNGQKRNPTLYY